MSSDSELDINHRGSRKRIEFLKKKGKEYRQKLLAIFTDNRKIVTSYEGFSLRMYHMNYSSPRIYKYAWKNSLPSR